jgi:hypothetical protein
MEDFVGKRVLNHVRGDFHWRNKTESSQNILLEYFKQTVYSIYCVIFRKPNK